MRRIALCGFLAVSLFIAGCDKGPAEETGEAIDNTVEDISDKLQDTGPAQKAGEAIDNTVEDISDKLQDKGPAEKAGEKIDNLSE